MSHQGPRRYRQPDVHDHPAPEPPTASTGPNAGPNTGEFAAVSGYAELTAYRRAGYAGFPEQGFPPPPYEQPGYQEQPAYQGRHSGPIPAAAPGQDPGVHQTPGAHARPTAYAGLRKPAPESGPEVGHRASRHLLAGLVTGLLAAAVAISGSVLAAMLLRPLKSPVSAVAAILRSPTVANFAGEHFGSREHVILLALPWLVSAVAAVIIGLVARRHRVAGVIGIVAFFGVAGAFIVATRPGSHAADVVPSLVGGVAGAVALVALASVLVGPAAAARDRS